MGKAWQGRSEHETLIGQDLQARGVDFEYEKESYNWEQVKTGWYTPDFFLPSGKIIEAKGALLRPVRQKLQAVKAMHPDLPLHLLLHERDRKRKSMPGCKSMTYEQWGEKYGIPVAFGVVPEEWL